MVRGLLRREVKPVRTLQRMFCLVLIPVAAFFLCIPVQAESRGNERQLEEEAAVSLSPYYYLETCPLVEETMRVEMESAVYRDPQVAPQLLRLHFHDCFVMGCDASLLLESKEDIISEKEAGPNLHSVRGFDIIDNIKASLEEVCPLTVSCADILAIAARDAVLLVADRFRLKSLKSIATSVFSFHYFAAYTNTYLQRGGPDWQVLLGRKDSLKSSISGANQYIPSPNFTLPMLVSNFHEQGLDITDLVALSGSHTIGRSRCLSFKQGIYDYVEEERDRQYHRSTEFRRALRSICPESGSRNDARVPLDTLTPNRFDNHYYLNLIAGMALLQSDRALISPYGALEADNADLHKVVQLVWAYAADQELFFSQFANSMVKMGNIRVLTGSHGEVRHNCRYPNA